ncbi:MAG: hypothetical protein PHG02_09755 [Oscillospiraceae bacterium]|nr:hypothetical protein [Oscillospiraceae bacterium]
MKGLQESLTLYTIGAFGYSALEILWRGYTHWTMALTGGLCFLSYYYINSALSQHSILLRCLMGCVLITAVEFLIGCVVNRGFHLNVWDYSDMPFNVMGQICLTYTVLWFLLCIPLTFACDFLQRQLR